MQVALPGVANLNIPSSILKILEVGPGFMKLEVPSGGFATAGKQRLSGLISLANAAEMPLLV